MHKSILVLLLSIYLNIIYASPKLKEFTLQLSWFNQFQFAGYYIAKEKGFYKDLGLDINIKPFNFDVNTIAGISEEKYDFTIARETLLLEKAKDNNLIALYPLFQVSPLVLFSTKESGINSLNKFNKKRIMTTIDDTLEASIKAMLISKNLSLKNLNFMKHTHNINDLINKKTDVISGYISKSPYKLEQMNIEYNIFNPKDYGFDLYSDFLITSKKLINKDFKVVQNFKEASLKGWEYAYENIEESVSLILKKYNTQNLSREALIFEAKELKKLSFYNTNKLGDINKSKLQRIHDLYNLMGLLPKKLNLDDFLYKEPTFYSKLSLLEKKFLKENPILKVGEEVIKPLNYLSDIGLHKGIAHDYLAILSQKIGVRFIPYIEKDINLTDKFQKDIDLLLISYYKKEEDILKTIPYFEFNEVAFKLKNTYFNNVNSVGIINRIYSKEREEKIRKVYPNIKIKEYISIDKLMKDLNGKRIDLIYGPKELIFSYIKNNNINNVEYSNTNIESNIIPISMGLKIDDIILENILSKTIGNISKEQHNAIRNKWIPLIFEKEIDWSLVFQILSLIITIALLLLYKQISLNNVNKKLSLKQEELIEINRKLKESSELDHLTNLYNRRYFENVINDILTLERRENKSTSLLMFDIDDFKKINDTFGHKIGDEVLIQLSNLLRREGRKSDIIARIGGEEFIILLPNTCIEGAKICCENLRKEIENLLIIIDNNKIQITVSMGLTTFKSEDTINKVLSRIDNSLYDAKRSGKNKLIIN